MLFSKDYKIYLIKQINENESESFDLNNPNQYNFLENNNLSLNNNFALWSLNNNFNNEKD